MPLSRIPALPTLIFLCTLAATQPANAADGRMAGRVPGMHPETNASTPTGTKDALDKGEGLPKPVTRPNLNNAVPPSPVINTPRPHFGKAMGRKAMEKLGPLVNPLKGGLGKDMWEGSKRSTVQAEIPQLPTGDTLRAVQILARRVLLSNGDAGMLNDDVSVKPGDDLFTLRVEKLVQMGAYSDAVKLYTLIEGEPGHDALAHAGVMALMAAGYPAQACLEARAAHRDDAKTPGQDDLFWPQIDAVCDFVETDSLRLIKDTAAIKTGNGRPPVTAVPGSKILTALVSRADYRQTIDNPKDMETLSAMERAVLRGLGRFDYSRLTIKNMASIPTPVLMIMAGDPNMPVPQRLDLNLEALKRGVITADGLGALYASIEKQTGPSGPDAEPSHSLFGRYVLATDADTTTKERNAVVAALLETHAEKNPLVLLPFANMLPGLSPKGLSAAAVRAGLVLMLEDGINPPDAWVGAWLKVQTADSLQSGNNLLLYLANLVSENLPTESVKFPKNGVKALFSNPESPESLDIYSVFSALGQEKALQGFANKEVYEKHLDLTAISDYVMPKHGLIDKLHAAAQNGRFGETALLAAVALKRFDPAKTHPGVLREVIRSLETVGLKEEARNIALCVILGFQRK